MSQFPADPNSNPVVEADPFDELARLINGDTPAPVPVAAPSVAQPAPLAVTADSDYDIQAAMEGRAPTPISVEPPLPVFDPVPSGVHQVPTRGPLAQVASRAAHEPEVESPLDAVFDLTALRAAFAKEPTGASEPIAAEIRPTPYAEPVVMDVEAPQAAPAPTFQPMPIAEASPTDRAEVVEPPAEFAAPISEAPTMFADMQAMMEAEAAPSIVPELPEAGFELNLEQELEAALMDDLAAIEPDPQPTQATLEPAIAATIPAQPLMAEREHFHPPTRNGKRRALAMTAAVLVMGGSAAGVWSLLGDSTLPDAPVILAQADAVKVKPDDAGGAAVPNQDTALFKSEAAPHQDALKSGTEKPVEVALAPRPTKVKTQIRRALPPTARKVRTVVVKPDGTIVAGQEVVGTVTPRVVKSKPIAPKEVEPVVRKVSTAKPPAEPVWGEADAPAAKTIVPKAKSMPVAEPKKVAKELKVEAAPKRSSDYVVQISSRRSPESARNAFAKLKRRYSSVLGDREAEYQKTDIAGKGTFYRVRVLASSKSDAGKLCSSLKRAGGSCFVTR